MDPSAAVYVEGSSVHPCRSQQEVMKDQSGSEYERIWDRCLPSVIACGSKEAALRFQNEHGGELWTHEKIFAEIGSGMD